MGKGGNSLKELLNVEVPPERLEDLLKLVEFDLPNLSDDVKKHLLKQRVALANLEYARYAAGTRISNATVDQLVEDSIDTHVHGGSEPFERRQLEDEIAIDATKAKMKAVVIKTWYTPSASRNALVQRIVDTWAEQHQMKPVRVFGGITLNYAVGGLNPEAVIRCLGYPGFKYVWMPMSDSYYHQRIVFNKKNQGIKYLTEDGKVVPELKDILRIIADNDLILATGHYPYRETAPLIEEAKRLGVRRVEIVHPNDIHSKHSIEQLKELAREGVKIGLIGIATINMQFLEGITWFFRQIKELSDSMVLATDAGQIQNLTHIEGVKWLIRILLAHGITHEEITKMLKTNPAEHLNIA